MLTARVDALIEKLGRAKREGGGLSLSAPEASLLDSIIEASGNSLADTVRCGYCFDDAELDGTTCDECCEHCDKDGNECLDCGQYIEYDYDIERD
jgi:hypothetical protein